MIFAGLDDAQVAAICGAIVALAVPINTAVLLVISRRQKEANHHTETIRQLATVLDGGHAQIPPEELGERVTDAAAEAEKRP